MIFSLCLNDIPFTCAMFFPLFNVLINSTSVSSPSPLTMMSISGKSMSDSSGTNEKCMPPTIVTMSSLTFFAISEVRAHGYAVLVNPELSTIDGEYDSIYFSRPAQSILSA